MENHNFKWENSLFLWPCSIVFVCVPYKSPFFNGKITIFHRKITLFHGKITIFPRENHPFPRENHLLPGRANGKTWPKSASPASLGVPDHSQCGKDLFKALVEVPRGLMIGSMDVSIDTMGYWLYIYI